MSVQINRYNNEHNIDQYTLSNSKCSLIVKVIDYGAIITNIYTHDRNGKQRDVVLGFDDLEGYFYKKVTKPYFGAAIGRVVNRIAKGTFTLNEKTYQLPINDGLNSIHGGNNGFDKIKWTYKGCTEKPASIVFELISDDGDEGFPGKLKVTLVYTVTDDNELKLEYAAELIDDDKDIKTIINLTNHTYFNLNGCCTKEGISILNHTAIVEPIHFLESDNTYIPTGKILSTKSDAPEADFTNKDNPHTIGERIDSAKPTGYNHCYIIETDQSKYKIEGGESMRTVATIKSPLSGISLTLSTTEPAFQFYTGYFISDELFTKSTQTCHWPKLPLGKYSGFCLETERFPNAINNEKWKRQIILGHGQRYAHKTIYKFSN